MSSYRIKSKEKEGFIDIIPPQPPDLSGGLIWVRRDLSKVTPEMIYAHISRADINTWLLTASAHGQLDYDKWREAFGGEGWRLSWQGHSLMLDIFEMMMEHMEKQKQASEETKD